MRTVLLAIGIVAAGLLAAWVLVDRRLELPAVGPGIERMCAETMQQRAADLSWVAPNRERVGGREIKTITIGELPSHTGTIVRVAGVLHAEFEWVALYPSRAAMEEQSRGAPWLTLSSLWPDEPYWKTKGPSISDRCVVIEGTYTGGAGGHLGMFNGTIDVARLDVWSTPHRPLVTAPPPPPAPPEPPCSEKPTRPEAMSADDALPQVAAEFNKLYETGEFQLGYCLAEVQINEKGTVDAVRVRRPQNVDERVASAIVRSMRSRRYKPASACGRPVPVTISVRFFHCPSKAGGR